MSCFFLSPCEVGGEIINLVTLGMAAAEPDDYFLLGPVYSPPAWQEPRRGLLRHSMLSVQHSGPPNHYLQNGSEYFKCNELSSNMRIKRDLLGGKNASLCICPDWESQSPEKRVLPEQLTQKIQRTKHLKRAYTDSGTLPCFLLHFVLLFFSLLPFLCRQLWDSDSEQGPKSYVRSLDSGPGSISYLLGRSTCFSVPHSFPLL